MFEECEAKINSFPVNKLNVGEELKLLFELTDILFVAQIIDAGESYLTNLQDEMRTELIEALEDIGVECVYNRFQINPSKAECIFEL